MSEDELFYKLIREAIILFLSFSTLFVVSFSSLRYIIKLILAANSTDEMLLLMRSGKSLVLWICSFALCMTISSLLLLPVSIIASEMVARIQDGDRWFLWLDESLVEGYWNWIFVGSNICLFFLLPFAYFYSEAEEGMASIYVFLLNKKIREAFSVWLLVACSVYALSHMVRLLLELKDVDFLVVLNAFCCLISALWCLRAYSDGMNVSLKLILSISVSPYHKAMKTEELELLKLEEQALRVKLQKLERYEDGSPMASRVSWKAGAGKLKPELKQRIQKDIKLDEEQLKEQLCAIEDKKRRLKLDINTPVVLRNALFLIMLLLFLSLGVLMLLQAFLNTVNGVFIYLSWIQETTSTFVSRSKLSTYLNTTASYLALFHVFIEILMMVFFQTQCTIGLGSYLLSAETPPTLPTVLFSLAAMLLQASCSPVMIRLLGISSFDLVGYYGIYSFLRNYYIFTVIYKFIFFLTTVRSIMFLWQSRVH